MSTKHVVIINVHVIETFQNASNRSTTSLPKLGASTHCFTDFFVFLCYDKVRETDYFKYFTW